jgi:hypothetical protein
VSFPEQGHLNPKIALLERKFKTVVAFFHVFQSVSRGLYAGFHTRAAAQAAGDFFPAPDIGGKRNRAAISGGVDPVPGIGPEV